MLVVVACHPKREEVSLSSPEPSLFSWFALWNASPFLDDSGSDPDPEDPDALDELVSSEPLDEDEDLDCLSAAT